MNCDPRLACLYFALVAVVLILILMQVWRVGYYRNGGSERLKTLADAINSTKERLRVAAPEHSMRKENLRVAAPEHLRVAAPEHLQANVYTTEHLRVAAPEDPMHREHASVGRACPNKALCEFMNPNAVVDPTLSATDATLAGLAQG